MNSKVLTAERSCAKQAAPPWRPASVHAVRWPLLAGAFILWAAAAVPLRAQAEPQLDKKSRERMARDLGKQTSTAIPQLQAMLKDPELDVRIEAVKSIVGIGTQHSLDPLIEATLDSDPEIQIRATDGLVNFYYPGYLATGLTASLKRVGTSIKARWTDTNDQIIDSHITVRPEVVEALSKLARGGIGIEVRANAARAVGILRGKAAIPDLLAALRTKNTEIIYEVLITLQKIRDPEVAPEIAFLLRDLNPKVQVAAIETTGLLQNKTALPQLRDVLERSRDKNVRQAALTAIAMLPDPADRPLYERSLLDSDEKIRAAAAEGFARLKNPADAALLGPAFEKERKMNPRLSMAFALVAMGRTELSEFSPLQYLVNSLNSSSWRGVAQAFLIELTREEAIRGSLYPGMRSRTRDEKIYLAGILGRSGDEQTRPILDELSRDGDVLVAEAGTRALRTLMARLH